MTTANPSLGMFVTTDHPSLGLHRWEDLGCISQFHFEKTNTVFHFSIYSSLCSPF